MKRKRARPIFDLCLSVTLLLVLVGYLGYHLLIVEPEPTRRDTFVAELTAINEEEVQRNERMMQEVRRAVDEKWTPDQLISWLTTHVARKREVVERIGQMREEYADVLSDPAFGNRYTRVLDKVQAMHERQLTSMEAMPDDAIERAREIAEQMRDATVGGAPEAGPPLSD